MELADGQFKASIKNASNNLKSVGEETNKVSSGPMASLKSTLTSVAKIAATAFAIDKIKDFGVASIEAAASAQAIQAQFEQTFGGLDKQASKSIEQLSSEFGMLPNRIKPAFTQTTAQFKGLGLDTEKAMEQASKATRIAADASAFYDKSMESAQASLNSFVKGNYEGGEAIGIFANDSQMAAFAVKSGAAESTKAWANMEEAQKQMIRLNFAEEMQKSAGATGQAAREADGYENVMGNVKQAWTDFLAIVGSPILGIAVKTLQSVTKILQSLGEKFKNIQPVIETFLNKTMETVSGLGGKLMPLFTSFTDGIKNIFTDLSVFWQQIFTGENSLGNIVTSMFNSIFEIALPILITVVETIKALIDGLVQFWTDLFSGENGLGNSFSRMFTSVKDIATPILEAAMNTIKSIISSLTQFWAENGQNIVYIVQTVWRTVAGVFETVMPVLKDVTINTFNMIKEVISAVMNAIGGIIKVITGIMKGDMSLAWEGIKQITESVWNAIKSYLNGLWNNIKSIGSLVFGQLKEELQGIWNRTKQSAETTWNNIKDAMLHPIEWAKDKISKIVDKIKDLFDFELKFPEIEIPHIPMPHFSMSGEFSLSPPSIPSIGVDWYQTAGVASKAREVFSKGIGKRVFNIFDLGGVATK